MVQAELGQAQGKTVVWKESSPYIHAASKDSSVVKKSSFVFHYCTDIATVLSTEGKPLSYICSTEV